MDNLAQMDNYLSPIPSKMAESIPVTVYDHVPLPLWIWVAWLVFQKKLNMQPQRTLLYKVEIQKN